MNNSPRVALIQSEVAKLSSQAEKFEQLAQETTGFFIKVGEYVFLSFDSENRAILSHIGNAEPFVTRMEADQWARRTGNQNGDKGATIHAARAYREAATYLRATIVTLEALI